MTPRNIFKILLRIMGVYILKDLIGTVGSVFFSFDQFADSMSILLVTVGCGLYFGALFLLLFKTDLIIDTLKLDKGFKKEEFSFNENRSELLDAKMLLNMALMFCGLFILVTEIPSLASYLITYLNAFRGHLPTDASGIAYEGLKILLALLVVVYHAPIADYIERHSVGVQKNGD